MALKVTRVNMWVAPIKDKVGSASAVFDTLAQAGVNIEFVIARRTEKRGQGVVFLSPIAGPAQIRAAKKLGFRRSKSLNAIKVEGPSKRGEGARITGAVAAKGLSMRGLSAAVIGRKYVAYFAFDKSADATEAARILKALD